MCLLGDKEGPPRRKRISYSHPTQEPRTFSEDDWNKEDKFDMEYVRES